MRTTLDISDILFGLVNTPDVTGHINGGIYKNERPDGSDKRDIVCTGNTVDGEAFQTGIGYVNIHDPGKKPDHVFFKSATDAATAILKANYKRNDYSMLVTHVTGPNRNAEANGFFMSIRIWIRMYPFTQN